MTTFTNVKNNILWISKYSITCFQSSKFLIPFIFSFLFWLILPHKYAVLSVFFSIICFVISFELVFSKNNTILSFLKRNIHFSIISLVFLYSVFGSLKNVEPVKIEDITFFVNYLGNSLSLFLIALLSIPFIWLSSSTTVHIPSIIVVPAFFIIAIPAALIDIPNPIIVHFTLFFFYLTPKTNS